MVVVFRAWSPPISLCFASESKSLTMANFFQQNEEAVWPVVYTFKHVSNANRGNLDLVLVDVSETKAHQIAFQPLGAEFCIQGRGPLA